uniref:RING-type domain-containing protein n=1 Tax=Meloidogyne hapla TaxID=6305 RepID=A0A1I8BP08_MELHA
MEGRRILLRESNVLNFFEENEAKHIIKMLDMNSSYNFDVLVLERAKMNIKKYFQENVNKKESEIDKFEFLTKIIKGAAEALAELHEYGYVHLNVKPENFVYTEIPKDENKIENCKLTGLDKAVTLGMTSEEDTIQFVLNNFGIKENIQEFCIICLGTNNSNFVQFPCNHFVHMNCIKPWLKTSLCCPNCKNVSKGLY